MNNKILIEEENNQKKIKEKINNEEENLIKNLKKCKKDNDCKNDEYCAFNENNDNHYCIPNKIYMGCLKNNDSMHRFLKASDKKYSENINNCIDFARKLNNNEIIYDYIHFKPKIETPIKKNSIHVDLNCGNMKIINLPYEDSFKEDCDSANENCKVVPKDNIEKILKNNLPNCKKDYHLNVNYTCDIENINKNLKIDLTEKNINKLEFNLKCPINENKYESQCTLFSLKDEDNVNLDKIFDSEIVQQKCNYASYLVPNIINDINEYNLKKNKKLEKSMESFNDIISADQEELNKKKALQYMVEYEKQFNSKISYDEALKYIKSTIENLTNEDTSKIWDITTGANKIPFENNSTNYSNFTRIGGNNKFFTTNDPNEVINFVKSTYTQTNYPDYIVYFSNSTLNNPNAGKAFALSFEDLKKANKVESSSWIYNIQTTSGGTGGSAFTFINILPSSETKRSNYFTDLTTMNYNEVQKEINNSLQKLNYYQEREENIITNKSDEIQKNINYMNQRIKNSNYQSNMNKQIIRYLYILLIFIFIITLAYFVYMNQINKF
jgi:hypothetical protein